ncbi:hypothetical protein [uncultured Tateyamaria sp.]|uniref:hypothetical protein n=1 Tax=uncultured Tateyamaria sp. TaxID=455651 RepID=UPI002633BF4A|nr:hypothetical protein [uncultured Tateyamaria sp.]
MTATFDATTDTGPNGMLSRFGGPRNLGRFALRTVGAVLVVAGIGVWLEPTAYPGPDLVAMKLGLSLFLSLAGFLILHDRDADQGPELHIDTVRREVRLVKSTGGRHSVLDRTPLRDLGKAEDLGDTVRLSAANGEVLGCVSMADPQVRARLCGALQDAGKL